MLEASLRSQLVAALTRLVEPVVLVPALDDSPASATMRGLLADLVAASAKVSIGEPVTDPPRTPSFGVARVGERPRIWFAGAPLGHEFTSLVLALLHVSGHPPRIDADKVAQVRRMAPVGRLETWVSLTCHNCPDVVQAIDTFAALNDGVEHVVIDGAVFPAEAETRGIRAVPTTLRDGEIVSSGRSSFDELLARLDVAAAAIDETVDVAVVGGGPAGASAAIYAARKGIKTALVAERFGGQVGDTLGIENLVSVAYTEGPKLVAEMERHVAQYGVRLVTGRRVVALRTASDGGLHELHLDGGGVVRARAVVLAPGARWRELGVPGEREHRTKGVTFCPHCDGPLFKGKDVAVVGGGNSGVEAAIDLAGLARRVTLLEFDDRLRADAVLQDRLRALPNVDVRCNARTTEVLGDGTRVSGLRVQDRATGELGDVGVDGVFVQIGLTPGTDWLRGAVALNPRGEIEVDAAGRTSVPGVFAAGDATTAPYKQIVVAMGDGAKAALSAFDWLIRHPVAAAA